MPRRRPRRTPPRLTPDQVEQRRAAVPPIRYPDQLPVSARKDEIAEAIREHQVVVIAGETGSGKTTQIPKICLEVGRGVHGQIGHTQPRRLAARTVAERIAEELEVDLGAEVGYAVRFTDKVSRDGYVKVMTDGILLAEIQRDRMLRRYDTIIIDEAHERSLNIDFLLGSLKTLLPKRPDLKLIITSATIDPEAFSRHFDDAPIIEVSGRTYPVEIRYRPLVDPDHPEQPERDLVQGVLDACAELSREAPGDVLVFLSGEREIRDVADALRDLDLPRTEILPLYARLSAADQHRVFSGHRGRRIVLATNVAETSLTVPGIKYVVDAGTARISRYSHATKVQRLPIERVSQASAQQRSGRCGRTSDGIAIRLYSEEDFDSRPEFTDPEITRTNLGSVILQMVAARLGDIETFPFVQPPDKRSISDGMALLQEIGAIERNGTGIALTRLGRQVAVLPIDPRLARMIVEAGRRDAALAVMIIAAALSIQDPRERPTDQEAQADQLHARFVDKTSDFLGILNLWRHLREQQKTLSSSAFRRLCKREYINYVRVREWQDLVAQLREMASTAGIHTSSARPSDDDVHKSVLTGLLSQVGLQDPRNKREYIGARGTRFAIFPGSALFKKSPAYVMAGELVETSRLWARDVARLDPAWVEEVAGDVLKRSYAEPHWERKRAAVVATERATLYGVPIVADRKVNYGRIDPTLSREIFIRQALVEGDWETRHHFFARNRELLAEVGELEDKARRRDILADDESLFAFYDARIPANVVSGRHFDKWWKHERHTNPTLLDFTADDVIREGVERPDEDSFPDVWRDGARPLELTYTFDPAALDASSSEQTDGISVDIPLVTLAQTSPEDFEWLVPGRREELVTALIKSLPKAIRRNVVPAPDRARAALQTIAPEKGALLPQLALELRRLTGAAVDERDFDWSKVPDHLRMTFRIVDERSEVVAVGKDLDELRERLAGAQRAQVATVARANERSGLTSWDVGTIDRVVALQTKHGLVDGYPALVAEAGSVALRVLHSPGAAEAAMRGAVAWLLVHELPSVSNQVMRALTPQQKVALTQAPHASPAALWDDVQTATALRAVDRGPLPWDLASYETLRDAARAAQVADTLEMLQRTAAVLEAKMAAERALDDVRHETFAVARADVVSQLKHLVPPGFIARHGAARLPDIERYLRGIAVRLERLRENRHRDRLAMLEVHDLVAEYDELAAAFPTGESLPRELGEIRWMIEELRLSLFAQVVKPRYSISASRIRKAMDRI
ncbi:ATP-dependent RNA helicase HrpA [Blastococcus sp. Marseille-P5729]|uniref:ATP-dependent RNA helicase HrpA n=1 Tax=Blastococcus sp. Marseille-P5729 TaxID=2086582 RepID=UPI000D10CEAE|nr:ATP-dependent RNA helicase HrpA [Blastococcus sp. Marseille-P5729]